MKIQLNRSLPIKYVEAEKKIVCGQTFMDITEIEDCPAFLLELLEELNVPAEFDYIAERYNQPASEEAYNISEILNNLIEEKIVSYTWEQDRYDRHRLFFELSGMNQADSMNALRDATVGIIGTGGIGSNVATLLAAAGIGRLKVSDGDLIEESNLTRTTTFKESQIGTPKIDSLKANLAEQNSSCEIHTLPHLLSRDKLHEFISFFSDCDILVLSADPSNAFELIGVLHSEINIPVINAGYLGRMGLVGPMMDAYSKPGFEQLFKTDVFENVNTTVKINKKYQAPSYGPLNYIVSSICSNEVIKFVATGHSILKEKRLIINPDNYETLVYDYKKDLNLNSLTQHYPDNEVTDQFDIIADFYKNHREGASLNRVILDDYVREVILKKEYASALDIGCGIGTYSRMLDLCSARVVALDTNKKMLDVAREKGGGIEYIQCDLIEYESDCLFDFVILSLVLDHINDYYSYIKKVRSVVNREGRVLCIVPSHVKDSCTSHQNDKMVIENYFYEGTQTKSRLDEHGNFLCELNSFKRNLSTYVNSFIDVGFSLVSIKEPRHPDKMHLGYNFPYFTVLEFKYGN
ncbi:TPA: ThiF family adenylyltransferase [Serratia marcescens]